MPSDMRLESALGARDSAHIRELTTQLFEDLRRALQEETRRAPVNSQTALGNIFQSEIRRPSSPAPSLQTGFEPPYLANPELSAPAPANSPIAQPVPDFSIPRMLRTHLPEPLPDLSMPAFVKSERPIPIPTVWRSSDAKEEHWLMERLRAAPVWLAIGMAVLLIIGLFKANELRLRPVSLSGSTADEASALLLEPTPAQPEPTSLSTASPSNLFTPTPLQPARRKTDAQIEEASRLATIGDLARARQILEPLSAIGDAKAAMALAETYDPNVTRARGAPDRSDIAKARMLYGRALAAGIERARPRLEALN